MKLSTLFVLISSSMMTVAGFASTHSLGDHPQQRNSESLTRPPFQGTFTRGNWIEACPTGESGLLQGCFTKASTISHSPLYALVNPMWSAINTAPTNAPNSVYIKKFPAGYSFSYNSNKALRYDATQIPSNSKAWCTMDAIAENGMDIDCTINNDPNSPTGNNCIYNVSVWARGILSGGTLTQDILRSTPYSGSALPLGIPFYVICIGANRTTGLPDSIEGMAVY